jgi:hypothetical protein
MACVFTWKPALQRADGDVLNVRRCCQQQALVVGIVVVRLEQRRAA